MISAVSEWLDTIDKYYFSDYIKAGGAAFKLLLTHDSSETVGMLGSIRSLAQRRNFVYVQVSADETRIDKIDQIFFEIARQIDWDDLIKRDAAKFLHARDYEIPENVNPSDIAAIAEANGSDVEDVMRELRRATRWEIVEDRRMCKEFRTAIAQLRYAQFFPRSVTPTDTETISCWMKGEKVSATALRDLRIYSKIGRHNAREMLIALARWLATSLGMGLVIGLDLTALLCTRPADPDQPPSLRYSRSALLDAYEVIRQFIDETDDISHCFICAAAPNEIETDEKRSIFKYYALQSRLLSDVHDLHRQDYLAAMVRLGQSSDERVGANE